MTCDKHATREAWFRGFDEWQTAFNAMLSKCAKTSSKARAIGKAFLQDVMIPFMDSAKDRLLADIANQVQAACSKASRLDELVNKENK